MLQNNDLKQRLLATEVKNEAVSEKNAADDGSDSDREAAAAAAPLDPSMEVAMTFIP